MAVKHRKLFPIGAETNQTIDCPEFCDTACPYNCYPYSDYYLLPPPPPPPPPSFLTQERHLSPYVIVIVALLASFFLIVSYYVIVAKSCSGWCGSRNNTDLQAQEDNSDDEFLDENRVDHPIWFITTVGLQQSIINSITVCKYKKGEGLIEGTECSVCLVNGPVSTPLISVDQNHENLNPTFSTQMENSDAGSGLGNDQESNEHCENRAGTEEMGEILQVGEERTSKDEVNSNDIGDLHVLSSSVDNDMKLMRRSSSMDSSRATAMCIGLNDHSPLENQIDINEERKSNMVLKRGGGYSSVFKLTGTSSLSPCLHKDPVSMKRSFSCGGRLFSSRQDPALNSILPL
ncbi:RING-H2 FINGER PROTEIN ATL51-RELATED [Salix koriyanagi]|uniref:RING-type E3 ubiquitin transferase n=1 Tax=Salix koriyanagi TaxID=2511006 RepID=A0A9Q0TDC9_9ROSI|nr:RING-H2 FINGER PROTEIN ATL51-RELATED [Salix koriyanagi]